jgi:hypothetical protein
VCRRGSRFARRGQRPRQPTGHADHLAAIFGPGQTQGTHGGRFPGTGRCDRKLKTCAGAAHPADQCGLPNIEGGAVRRHLQQSQIHRRLTNSRPVASPGSGEEALFGVEDSLRGVQLGARDGVDDDPSTRRNTSGSSMSSADAARATQRRSSTSSANRSTSVAACSAGTSMVRTCRCASARTCHICQVERLAAITVRM